MPILEFDPYVYGWLSRVQVSVTSVFVIVVLCLHVAAVRSNLGSQKIEWTGSLVFSFILIFVSLACLGVWSFNSWTKIYSVELCYWPVTISLINYFLVKWALYMLLSFRLDTAFRDSKYAYSKKSLNGLRIFLCLAVMIDIVITLLGAGVYVEDDVKILTCRVKLPSYVLAIVALLDFIACTLNLFLFVRQLYRVTAAIRRNDTIFETSLSPITQVSSHDSSLQLGHRSKSVSVSREHTPDMSISGQNKSNLKKNETKNSKNKDCSQSNKNNKSINKLQLSIGTGNSSKDSDMPAIETINSRSPSASPRASEFDNEQEYHNGDFHVNINLALPPGACGMVPSASNDSVDGDQSGNGNGNVNNGDIIINDEGNAYQSDNESPNSPNSPNSALSMSYSKKKHHNNKKMMAKLKRMSTKSKASLLASRQDAFVEIIRKHVVLTSLGVGTTILTMMLIGMFAMSYLWASVDIIFNIVTTLLMFSWNKPLYNKYCICFENCCSNDENNETESKT